MKAKALNQNIDLVVSKPIRVDINVNPYDLPKELEDRRKKLEKYKSQKELLDFKDKLI